MSEPHSAGEVIAEISGKSSRPAPLAFALRLDTSSVPRSVAPDQDASLQSPPAKVDGYADASRVVGRGEFESELVFRRDADPLPALPSPAVRRSTTPSQSAASPDRPADPSRVPDAEGNPARESHDEEPSDLLLKSKAENARHEESTGAPLKGPLQSQTNSRGDTQPDLPSTVKPETSIQRKEPEAPSSKAPPAKITTTDALARIHQSVRPTAQTIQIRLAAPDASSVDVSVVDRGGKVHVAVRSPEPELSLALRQDLGKLTSAMQGRGYGIEAFTPGADASVPERASLPSEGGDREQASGGDSSGSRQQQGQRRQDQPEWVQELEDASGSEEQSNKEVVEWLRALRA